MLSDLPVEALKAWSQNLGHQDVLTTLTSYGAVCSHRQGELIRQGLAKKLPACPDPAMVAAVIEVLQARGGTRAG